MREVRRAVERIDHPALVVRPFVGSAFLRQNRRARVRAAQSRHDHRFARTVGIGNDVCPAALFGDLARALKVRHQQFAGLGGNAKRKFERIGARHAPTLDRRSRITRNSTPAAARRRPSLPVAVWSGYGLTPIGGGVHATTCRCPETSRDAKRVTRLRRTQGDV